MIFRSRFGDVVRRQLDLFAHDQASLMRDCVDAERAYDRAPREEAEQRYGDYLDLVAAGTELLGELRDNFASTLPDDAAEEYEATFNRGVLKRFPRFAVEIEDT